MSAQLCSCMHVIAQVLQHHVSILTIWTDSSSDSQNQYTVRTLIHPRLSNSPGCSPSVEIPLMMPSPKGTCAGTLPGTVYQLMAPAQVITHGADTALLANHLSGKQECARREDITDTGIVCGQPPTFEYIDPPARVSSFG